MWRKIIEKMYDPEDSNILEQRFYDIIQFREDQNEQLSSNNLFGYQTANFGGSALGSTKNISDQ